MITLIAESKTMQLGTVLGSESLKDGSTPVFQKEANEIIRFLSSLDKPELAQRIKISPTLASKAAALIYDFNNPDGYQKALFAFTGEVFKSLNAKTLDPDALNFANSRLLIVSSLYGILRPEDLIKSYRLDFNCDTGPSGENLIKYWKPKLTVFLGKLIKQSGHNEILDLLPGEASKMIDWKLLKAFAKVWKVNIKHITPGGELKTPDAGKLKNIRGSILRNILESKIDSLKDLSSINIDDITYDQDGSKPDYPLFISHN